MIIAVIVLLVVIIAVLMFYNMSIHKKIQSFNNINQKITNLNILQDFMNTLGECTSTNEKLEKINNILIEKYEIKYSTIVTYNGAEYVVRASNVEEKHWETLSNLNSEDIFKESIDIFNISGSTFDINQSVICCHKVSKPYRIRN